jgi:hypothetical protein
MSVASFLSIMNILLRIGVTFIHSNHNGRLRWTILSLKTLADFDILIDASRNDGSGVARPLAAFRDVQNFAWNNKKYRELRTKSPGN